MGYPERHMQSAPIGHCRILDRAAKVLGSQQSAELWMTRPAMGQNQQRPIDLLQTEQGAAVVEDFLTRMEYNVYS